MKLVEQTLEFQGKFTVDKTIQMQPGLDQRPLPQGLTICSKALSACLVALTEDLLFL